MNAKRLWRELLSGLFLLAAIILVLIIAFSIHRLLGFACLACLFLWIGSLINRAAKQMEKEEK